MLFRYGYQDTDEDKKTFKPVIPKTVRSIIAYSNTVHFVMKKIFHRVEVITKDIP